jgi:hypothetical protein
VGVDDLGTGTGVVAVLLARSATDANVWSAAARAVSRVMPAPEIMGTGLPFDDAGDGAAGIRGAAGRAQTR